MEIITFLVCVVIFVVIFDYMWKPRDNKIPFRIPVLGHVKLLANNNVHHTLTDWAHKYGDIYTVQSLNMDATTSSLDEINLCSDVSIPVLVHSSLFTALCIITVLAFLERRKKDCLDCCNGRPGLVIPINMLDDFKNRWSYACSFGAMINAILTLFVSGDAYQVVDQTYSVVFLSLIYAGEVCLSYFPFFACLITRYQFIGAIMGGLYAGYWFFAVSMITIDCTLHTSIGYSAQVIAIQVPALICLAVVIFRFGTVAYEKGRKGEYLVAKQPENKVMTEFQLDFVKYVYSKNKQKDEAANSTGCRKKIKDFISTHIWEHQPHFKFSTRIICTMFVAVLITYQLTLVELILFEWSYQQLKELADTAFNASALDPENVEIVTLTGNLLEAGCFILAVLCLLLLTLDIFIILTKYRTNLLQLYRGDYSFLPKGYNASSSEIMRFAMVFPGYQIAYKMWGLFVLIILGLIVMGIAIGVIVACVASDALTVISSLAAVIVIPAAVSIGLRYLQQALCYFVFLPDKLNIDDEDKPLAMINRALYHITNYFFFIANIPIGIFSSSLRIGRSFLYGLIFLGRVDRCVLPPGFEDKDKGYMAYLGMLLMEHTHNNPILRVFCQYLLWTENSTSKLPRNPSGGFENIAYVSHQHVNEMNNYATDRQEGQKQQHSHITKAKIRWLLFITLANNPDLIALRKHHIQAIVRVKDSQITAGILKVIKTDVLGMNEQNKSRFHSHTNSNSVIPPHVQALIARQYQERNKKAINNGAQKAVTSEQKDIPATKTDDFC